MAKTTVLSTFSINHSTDTVVTLPKSGKTIIIKKDFPAGMIANLDNYINKHPNIPDANSSSANVIKPNISDCPPTTCPYVYYYIWILQDQYKLASGYHMGTWVTSDVISYSQAFNQYGFDELAVTPGEINTALGIGFKANNLMMLLPDNQLPIDLTDMHNNPSVGYYFIDEPVANGVPLNDVQAIELYLTTYIPSAKFLISAYNWPVATICNGWLGDENDGPYLTSSNSGIMCDQYVGNLCGSMKDYWNEYWNFYGSHSWMNWANNTGGNAGSWPDCFNWMNVHGINNVWLYASKTGDEGVIQNWCATAWQYFWSQRYMKQYVYICASVDCSNCNDFPNGNWDIISEGYTGVVGLTWY
jgi:hypothetical protein